MSWILRTLAKHKKRSPSDQTAGVVQLEKHGLFDEPTVDGSTAASAPDSTSGFLEIDLGLEEWATSWGSRTHEESEEEAMLRRRRREAVIIEEDGQPAGSADIIQRLPTDLPDSPMYSAQEVEILQQIRNVNLVDFQRITQSID